MRLLTAGLLFAIFFPIFGKAIPRIAALPGNLMNYGLIVCVGVAAASFFGVRRSATDELPWFKWLFRFLVLLLAQYSVRLIITDVSSYEVGQAFRNFSSGVFYGLAALLLIRRELALHRRGGRLFDAFALLLSVAVLFQGLGSMVESRRGEYLGDYEQDVNATLESRNLLTALGDERIDRLGFSLAFTGLMGQHNRYGSMLIYLNLIFLIQLLRTRSPYYLGMVGFTALLAIGNTTKTSIAAIALSNIVLLPAIYSNVRWLRVSLVTAVVLVGGIAYGQKLTEAVYATGGEGSMLSRIDYWIYLKDQWLRLLPDMPVGILFGLPFGTLTQLSVGYNELLNKSFENEFVAMLFRDGVVGAFAYVALIVGLLVSQRKLSGQSRLAALALVACVLLSSLLMDFQLRYHNVVFICLSLYAIFELLPGAKPVSGGRQSAAGSDASPQGVSLRRVEA